MAKENSKKAKSMKVKQIAVPDKSHTISACMIVKNEEELLPQCLDSIRQVVDEIIIVDTGSTDGTVEIAKSHGAKVFHHRWENDFSKHRNQSIGYASGDWILWIDADEAVKEGCGNILKQAVSMENADSITVPMVNYFNGGMSQSWFSQVKAFRNNRGIHFANIVHNRLVGYQSTAFYPIYIHHYGYDLSEEKMKEKFARTTALLNKQIEVEPGAFRHRHDLAACYLSNRMFEEAATEGSRAIEMANIKACGEEGMLLWTHFITSFAYLKLGDLGKAERYAHMALQAFPEHLDSQFVLVNVYHEQQQWDSLKSACDRYLSILKRLKENTGNLGNIMHNTVNEEWRVYLAVGDLFLELKQRREADGEFERALSLTPNPSECHKIIGNFFAARGAWDLAKNHLNAALEHSTDYPDAWLGLARVYKALQQDDRYRQSIDRLKALEPRDVETLKEIGICELIFGNRRSAIDYFKKVLEQGPDDIDTLINLGLAYKHEGRFEDARQHYVRALEFKGDSVAALSNLGHLYFETAQYGEAKHLYRKAIQVEGDLVDVQLRLATAYLFEGEIEGCVKACDLVLKALNLPRNRTLHDVQDLAGVFLLASGKLKELGKFQLGEEALKTGNFLGQIQHEDSPGMMS